jgi:hypothetical protein
VVCRRVQGDGQWPHPSSSVWPWQVPVSVGSPGQGPEGRLPEAGGRQVLFLVLAFQVAGWQEQVQGPQAAQEPGGGHYSQILGGNGPTVRPSTWSEGCPGQAPPGVGEDSVWCSVVICVEDHLDCRAGAVEDWGEGAPAALLQEA